MNAIIEKIRDWIDERIPMTEVMEKHLTKYSAPPNLTYWWAFGSIILFFFSLQILTGIWMSMFFKPDVTLAFDSVERMMREVEYGWLIRYLHANGASFILFAIYIHMARGIYYASYKNPRELLWLIGMALFMMMMLESFLGYVIAWGQMSYWAGTVITGFASIIPFIGNDILTLIRGDFTIGDPALGRFFSFHTTLLPIAVIGGLIFLHIIALHRVGSNNPDGVDIPKEKKIYFFPYYVFKDAFFIGFMLTVFLFIVFLYPDTFLERANYLPQDYPKPIEEIKPEWYFLPFFTILRVIPDKVLGIIAMNGGQLLLFLLPWLDRSTVISPRFRPIKRTMDIIFFANFILMGWGAMQAPVGWFLTLGRINTAIYFLYFILLPIVTSQEKAEVKIKEPRPETVKLKKAVGLVLLLLALVVMNIRAFTVTLPDNALIEEGQEIFEAWAVEKEGHTTNLIDSSYYEGATSEDFEGPDLSTIFRATEGEYIREVLHGCMEGDKCPHKQMKSALRKLKRTKGTEETIEALVAYFEYTSNPFEEQRKSLAKWVVFYMSILTVILYFLKRTFHPIPPAKEE